MHVKCLRSAEGRIARFDGYIDRSLFAWIEPECLRRNFNSPIVRNRKHAVALCSLCFFPARETLTKPGFRSLALVFAAVGKFRQVVRIGFKRKSLRYRSVI